MARRCIVGRHAVLSGWPVLITHRRRGRGMLRRVGAVLAVVVGCMVLRMATGLGGSCATVGNRRQSRTAAIAVRRARGVGERR